MNKIKRLVVLLFLVLFTTGCDVTYNLEIMGDNYNEYIVTSVNSDTVKNYPVVAFYGVAGNMEDPSTYAEDVEYYNDEVDSKNKTISFEYTFLKSNFSRSNFVNSCYKNFVVLDDNETDNIIVSTDRNFLCFDEYKELDDVTVKIKTNHEVISSNADNVDDDTYIWNITRTNKDDAAISMVISSEVIADELSFWEKNALFLIVLVVFVVGGILYILMKKHSEKVNEI